MNLTEALSACPIVAILRGITPAEAPAVGRELLRAGITMMEVPLNSPEPLRSIGMLIELAQDAALVGAGTVLTASQATDVARIGGQLIVAPNVDVAVGQSAQEAQAHWIPGVMSPTEAFTALGAGASAIKLFPAEMISPRVVKALGAVLPKETLVIVVGGVEAGNIAEYRQAGASGLGIGSSLYRPGDSPELVGERARALVRAVQQAP